MCGSPSDLAAMAGWRAKCVSAAGRSEQYPISRPDPDAHDTKGHFTSSR